MTSTIQRPAQVPAAWSTPSVDHHAGHAPRLSKRIQHLLAHGDGDGRYGGDPFRVVGAIIMDAARVDYSLEQLTTELADPRNAGGKWYRGRLRKRGNNTARRELEEQFTKARSELRPQIEDATDARLVVDDMRRRAMSRWAGRTAASRLKVYLAHLQVATNVGSLTYTASIRQIAELARVGRNVVRQRQDDLISERLLRRVSLHGSRATRWALLRTEERQADPVGAALYARSTGALLHDAFRHGSGLNGRAWNALDPDESVTAADIAVGIGVTVATARGNLGSLEAEGLAIRTDDGEWRRLGALRDLDRIADANGMADRSERQRIQHREDRIEHRRFASRERTEVSQ